jgi:MraZ protein
MTIALQIKIIIKRGSNLANTPRLNSFGKDFRVTFPDVPRSFAGLEKEIVVVGLIDKIELHSQVRYAEVSRRSQALLQADPQVVADFGF